MKLFFYYAFCSIKNQIRKLLKTWVAIFLVACFGFGILIGLGASFLEDLAGDVSEDAPVEEEIIEEEIEWTEEDSILATKLIELAAGGIVLLLLVFHAFGADKSGCVIFQQSDVNLLFPSPMKPQSVLLFRLMTQIGSTLLVSIYFLFQLPNIILNMGVSVWILLAVIAALILSVIFCKLLQILLYTLASTRPILKQYIRPAVIGVIGVVGLGFVLYWQITQIPPFDAAIGFFNAPITRWIPVWGWLKGIVMYALEGNLIGVLLSLFGMIALTAVTVWFIWSIKADFYEDALAKSEETAELQQAAQSEGRVLLKRKKDRSERFTRDGLLHGHGANVYFFKAMYNRFRFAHLHIFTKTSETYLLIGVGLSLFLRFMVGTNLLMPVAFVLAAVAFFRSLGNPLAQDTQMDSFVMVPESPWAKIFWSMLGGSANCALDLLPAFLAAVLILGASPFEAIAWILFIVSIDLYSTNVGVFIDFSIPVATSKNIKAIFQIMFIYFGLLPDIVLIILGAIFSLMPLFCAVAAGFNLAVAAVFFAFSPMFLAYGRK